MSFIVKEIKRKWLSVPSLSSYFELRNICSMLFLVWLSWWEKLRVLICVMLVRKVLPRNWGSSPSLRSWGLLVLWGTRRGTVETVDLHQSAHHCSFGNVAFPAGGIRTYFIGNSEIVMKHFHIRNSGDEIAGRGISKFLCLRECRLTCLYVESKGVFKLGKNRVGCMQRAVIAAFVFKGTDYSFQMQHLIQFTFIECLTCPGRHDIKG